MIISPARSRKYPVVNLYHSRFRRHPSVWSKRWGLRCRVKSRWSEIGSLRRIVWEREKVQGSNTGNTVSGWGGVDSAADASIDELSCQLKYPSMIDDHNQITTFFPPIQCHFWISSRAVIVVLQVMRMKYNSKTLCIRLFSLIMTSQSFVTFRVSVHPPY